MSLATVKELALACKLSESRVRYILGKPEAPKPVIDPINIHGGKIPGKYDLEEFKAFKSRAHFNMHIRDRWFYGA